MDPINPLNGPQVVTGLDEGQPAFVQGDRGMIRVNGGPWQSGPVKVRNGDLVEWQFFMSEAQPQAEVRIGGEYWKDGRKPGMFDNLPVSLMLALAALLAAEIALIWYLWP